MSIEIPPHFPDWLTRWVIGHFPVGDPDEIRAAAEGWGRSAERLTGQLRELERIARDVPGALEGEAGAAIHSAIGTQAANARDQIEFADGMAAMLYDSANAIELEQYIVIGIAAVLLANLLIDTAVPMKAVSDRVAADVAATTARRKTLTWLLQRAAGFMERFPAMALAIRATIMGAVSMGGVVAGAQYAQIVQGHGELGRRTSMDWGQVGVAATAGGAGGLVGSLATRAVLPAATRIGANATTPLGRATGRGLAILFASAAGGAAGGAAGALTMSWLTDTKLTGRNLVEMMMMGVGGGLIGGLAAASRSTRAMNGVRAPSESVPEIGRSRSGTLREGVLPELGSGTPRTETSRPRGELGTSGPRGEFSSGSGGSGSGGRREAAIGEAAGVSPRTGDGHVPRPSKEMVAEIDAIGKEVLGERGGPDDGTGPPPSDPGQPSSGTPQASPASPSARGSASEAGHGWGSWDDALRGLTEGAFDAAPSDPMAAPGGASGTGHPGTAQFHSNRPDAQMSLAGEVVAADGQPNATPGSLLTMSATNHADPTPHIASAKDLTGNGGGGSGGGGGGNGPGPGVSMGPPGSHGDSPLGGGPGSNRPGHGAGELPPDPDEAALLDLDFFDYETVFPEPPTPATPGTATPHAGSTTPIEPAPGTSPPSTPPLTPTEAKNPTTPVSTPPGPTAAPATPAPPINTPTAPTNTPQAPTNPQPAQTNSPQTPAAPATAQANPATGQPNPPAQAQANPTAGQPNPPAQAQVNPPAGQANPPAQAQVTPSVGQANPSPQAQANPADSQASPSSQAQANSPAGQANPSPQAQANPAAGQANPSPQAQADPSADQANPPALAQASPAVGQANPSPQPQANQPGAQSNPAQATSVSGGPAHNLAGQMIPPAALAGAAVLGGHQNSNTDTPTGVSTSPPTMSGGQPSNNNETPSDPEEFPDRIGTVVTPPMPSYVPAQPHTDHFPNNAPDEYTKPPGTTYNIPGQPNTPDGPPPNAIPIIEHPSTPAIPDPGPAIPLTDRPQLPIPDTAVPGAPTENDPDGQKPRTQDSEPPLPRHANNPTPHLPATPTDRPTELNPTPHYATPPNPQTPGAPTDPTSSPQLHRDSTQYIPDPTVQPTRGGAPATTLAGPLPEPVVTSRPVPMAQASVEVPKKRKRKPPPAAETPKPTPKPPAPVPKPSSQPRPGSRPATPPGRTRITTQSARTTGRDLAITLAGPTGRAANGAAGAIVLPALTYTEQRGRNLAEQLLMNSGGLATAVRPTQTTDTQRRPFADTITETDPALDHRDDSLSSLLLPPEPETIGDGHALWLNEQTIAAIDAAGQAVFHELDLNADHHTTPISDPALEGAPGHGWSSWDTALTELTRDTYASAPTDLVDTPANPSPTDFDSPPPPVISGAHSKATPQGRTQPSAVTGGRSATDKEEPTADPEEFPTPPGTTVPNPWEHNVQKDPREHSVWQDPRDHNVQKRRAGDYITIPGVTYPVDDEVPDNATPLIPHTPALTPIDLPADSARFTPAPQNPDDNAAEPTPTRPPEVAPLPRDSAVHPSHQDAVPEKPDTPILPTRYALEPNPETEGAPQKPARPQLNPHSLEYNPREGVAPALGGVPHLQPTPAPKQPVQHKRLIPQAAMGEDPTEKKRKKRSEKSPPSPPPQLSQENAAVPAAPAPEPPASERTSADTAAPHGVNSIPEPVEPQRPPPEALRLDDATRTHILGGDATGRGHRHGSDKPGKTEFPPDWSDDKIIEVAWAIARNWTEPEFREFSRGPTGVTHFWRLSEVHDGVRVVVFVLPDGRILTAWPASGPAVTRNPARSPSPLLLPKTVQINRRTVEKVLVSRGPSSRTPGFAKFPAQWAADVDAFMGIITDAGNRALRNNAVTNNPDRPNRPWLLRAEHDDVTFVLEIDVKGSVQYMWPESGPGVTYNPAEENPAGANLPAADEASAVTAARLTDALKETVQRLDALARQPPPPTPGSGQPPDTAATKEDSGHRESAGSSPWKQAAAARAEEQPTSRDSPGPAASDPDGARDSSATDGAWSGNGDDVGEPGGGRAEPARDLSALSEEAHKALDEPGAELRDLGSVDQITEQLMRDGIPGQTAVVLERVDGVDRARTLVYDGRRVVEVRDPNTDDGMIHEFVPGSSAPEQTRALVYSPVVAADRVEAEQALGRLLGRYDSDRFPEHFPDGVPDRPTRAAMALDFERPRTIDGPLQEYEWSTLAKLYPNEVSGSRGAPQSARAQARAVWGERYFPRQPVPLAETPAAYLARQAEDAIAMYSNTYDAGDHDGVHGWVDEEGVLLFQITVAEGTPSGQEMFRDMMAEIGSHVRAIRAPWSTGDSHTDNIDTFNAYRQDLLLSPEEAARRTFTGKMAGDMGFTKVTVNYLFGPVRENLIVDVTFSKLDTVYHRLMAAVGNPGLARNLADRVHDRAGEEQPPTPAANAHRRLLEHADDVLAEHRAAMAQLDAAVDNKPAPTRQQRRTPFQHAGLFFHTPPSGNQSPTPENPDEASAPDRRPNPTPTTDNESSTRTGTFAPAAKNQPDAPKQPGGNESLVRLVRTNPYLGVRLGAEFVNDAGFEVMQMVTALYFLEHGGPGLAGAVGWATQLPYLGGALIAGHLTDHTQPKKLLLGSQALAAATGIAAFATLASGTSYSVPILIGTTLVGASAGVLYNSAANKVIIEMVGAAQDGYGRFENLKINLTRALGQGFAPTALNVGAWTAPLIDVGTSIINMATMWRLPMLPTAKKPDDSESTWVHMRQSIAEGWRTVQGFPVRRRYNVNLGFTNFYLGAQGLQFASLIADSGLSPGLKGAALFITPLGGVVGTLIPRRWWEKTSIDTLLTARLAGLAVPAIVMASTTNPWLASAGFASTWAILGSAGIPLNTYVRKTTPSEVRARVGAIGVVTTRGTFAMGPAAAGGAIALLGHQATGISIAATFGTIAGWSLYQRLLKGRWLLDCINQTSQAIWALGLDTGIKPKKWQKSPEHLRRAIATQLVKIDFDPDTRGPGTLDPVAQTIEDIRNLKDGADTAVLLVADGKKMHAITITNTDNEPDGNIVIFDTNITNPGDPHTDPIDPGRIPRVRTLDKWQVSYPGITEAYVAFLTADDEDNLTSLHQDDPDQETPRKDGKVRGPLPGNQPPTPENPDEPAAADSPRHPAPAAGNENSTGPGNSAAGEFEGEGTVGDSAGAWGLDETPAEYLARHADEALAMYSNTYGAGDYAGVHGWVDQQGALLFRITVAEGTPSGQEMFRDMMAEIESRTTVGDPAGAWGLDETPAEYLARHADEALATYSKTYGAGDYAGVHGWVDQQGVLRFQIAVAEGTPTPEQMFDDMKYQLMPWTHSVRASWSAAGRYTDDLDTFNAYRQDLSHSPEEAARLTFTAKMAASMWFREVTVNHLSGPAGEHLGVDVTFSMRENVYRLMMGPVGIPRWNPNPTSETTVSREEWATGQRDIEALLPGHWSMEIRKPVAIRLISGLLDDAFDNGGATRATIALSAVGSGPLDGTITTDGRAWPVPDVPGPQDPWVVELNEVTESWSYAFHRNPPGRELRFKMGDGMRLPSTPGFWVIPQTEGSDEREPANLATGVRLNRDQTSLIEQTRAAIVQLAGAGHSQTLFPDLAFAALLDTAFRTTGADALVRATISDQGILRVEVADHSRHLPPLDVTRSPNQGIATMDGTADRWGVEVTMQGKTVWFEYAIDSTAVTPESDLRATNVAIALNDSRDQPAELLRGGTVQEVVAWLRHTWHVEMAGFTDPDSAWYVSRGLQDILSEHREIGVQNGATITVGKVSGGKGIAVAAHPDSHGRVLIESITVDRRLLGSTDATAGAHLYAETVGAIGAVADTVVGIVKERGLHYLFTHFLGSRPEPPDDAEAAFEEWVRGQLGERVIKPRTLIRRAPLSKRFDPEWAARAAVVDVRANGWADASDAARTLHRLLFAQLRIDPESRDILDGNSPEFLVERNWDGRGPRNLPDLVAAFEAQHDIPVVGTDISDIDKNAVMDFLSGIQSMLELFPGTRINMVGVREMDPSIKATPDESSGYSSLEVIINQVYAGGEIYHSYAEDFRFRKERYYSEGQYRFAKALVSTLGVAILDDFFPALLAVWLRGRDNGSIPYKLEFGEWVNDQFSRYTQPIVSGALPKRQYVHLIEKATIAESVLSVIGGWTAARDYDRKLSDGHRVLSSLLMKHLNSTSNEQLAERTVATSRPVDARSTSAAIPPDTESAHPAIGSGDDTTDLPVDQQTTTDSPESKAAQPNPTPTTNPQPPSATDTGGHRPGGGTGDRPASPQVQFYDDVDPAVDHGFFARRKGQQPWVLNNFGPVNPGPQMPKNKPTSGQPETPSDGNVRDAQLSAVSAEELAAGPSDSTDRYFQNLAGLLAGVPDADLDQFPLGEFDKEWQRRFEREIQDALNGNPPDQWMRMTISEMAATLKAEFGINAVEFDEAGTEYVAREYARAFYEVFTDLRDLMELDWVKVWRAVSNFGETIQPTTDGRCVRMYLNANPGANPAEIAAGFHWRWTLARFAYYVAIHELGHVLNAFAGGRSGKLADAALYKYFLEHHASPAAKDSTATPQPGAARSEYRAWLRKELSGYCLDRNGDLDAIEALPEGFADVRIRGRNASEASHVLHDLLIDVARTAATSAQRRQDCVIQLVRVLRSLGQDSAREPGEGENRWSDLEAAIFAQLVEVELPPGAVEPDPQQLRNSDPLAFVVDAIRHQRGGADTAVIVVERGDRSHAYAVTNDGKGEVVISDALASPQVRHHDNWVPPYPVVDRAFVGYFKSEKGDLKALFDAIPDDVPRTHPSNPITGRPNNPEDHPDESEAIEAAPPRVDGTPSPEGGVTQSRAGDDSNEVRRRSAELVDGGMSGRSVAVRPATPTTPSVVNSPSPWSHRTTPWSGIDSATPNSHQMSTAPQNESAPPPSNSPAQLPTVDGDQSHRPLAAAAAPDGPNDGKPASPWSVRKAGTADSTSGRTGTSRLEWFRRTAVDGDEAVARVRNGVGWVHLWHDPAGGRADEIIDAMRAYTASASANLLLRAMGKGLTPQQRIELSQREVTGAEIFAAGLSIGRPDSARWRANAETLAAEVNSLDWAYRNATTSTGPVKLYRRLEGLTHVFGRDHDLVGFELTDDAFMSTTISAEPDVHGDRPVKIIIYADEGATLLNVEPASRADNAEFDFDLDFEREILIRRGSTLRILTEPEMVDDVLILEAELISRPRSIGGDHTTEPPTPTEPVAMVSIPAAKTGLDHTGDRNAELGGRRSDAARESPNQTEVEEPSPPATETARERASGGGARTTGQAPGAAISFHVFDLRAALDLPVVRDRGLPFGHRRGHAGLDPALAFHHDPDDPRGEEWAAHRPSPDADEPTTPRKPTPETTRAQHTGDGSTAYHAPAPSPAESAETEGEHSEPQPRARAASAHPQPTAEANAEPSVSWFRNRIWTPNSVKAQPENKALAALNASIFITTAGSVGVASFLPVWVEQYSDSSQWTGIAMSAPALIALASQIPAGYIADHYDNRRTKRLTAAAGIAISGITGGFVIAELPGALFVVVGAAGGLALIRTIDRVSTMTYSRSLAKTDEQKKAAVTLSIGTNATAQVVGKSIVPAIGSMSTALLVDAASYAIHWKLLGKLPPAPPPPPQQRARMLDGARAIWQDPYLRSQVVLGFPWGLAGTASLVQLADLINTADYSPTTTGLVLSSSAAGVVLTATTVRQKVIDRINVRWVHPTTMAILAALTAEYTTTTNPWIIGPTSVVMGSAVMLTSKKFTEYMQEVVPSQALGGATSTDTLVNSLGVVIGGVVGGQLIATVGAEPSGWLISGTFAATAVASAVFSYFTRTKAERQTGPGLAGDGSTEFVAPDAGRPARGMLRRTLRLGRLGKPSAAPARGRPQRVDDCVPRVAEVLRALGVMKARAPKNGRNDARALEKAITARLTEVAPETLAGIIETVKDPDNIVDTVAVLVDDGTKMHSYVVTSVDGKAIFFDTNADHTRTDPTLTREELDELPRVQTEVEWQQSFTRVGRLFVAEFAINEKNRLEARHKKDRDKNRTRPRDGAITGPPTTGQPPNSHGMQPSRSEYETVELPIVFDEDPAEVELIRPGVDARGWFRGPDREPYHTEHPLGEPFLLLATGELITAQQASHDDLPYTLADQDRRDDEDGSVEVSGFGTWRISGRVKKIDAYWPGSVPANANPMIPAQILAALIDRDADLSQCEFDEFGADHQGTLWRDEVTPQRIDEAIRQGGLDQVLRGYGLTPGVGRDRVVFWVELVDVESAAEGASFTVVVKPVRSDPARLTLTVHRDGDTITVRYSHVDLGRDHVRAAAVVRVLHDKFTAWLAQSGASWADDSNTAPVENR